MRGPWSIVDGAVTTRGQTLDFRLTAHRDVADACRFFAAPPPGGSGWPQQGRDGRGREGRIPSHAHGPGADHEPVLDIQLFGRFLARIDGLVVDDKRWGRRSAKTLVKVLSLAQAHTLHREQMIEMLWPDLASRTAANNLDKAIHGARRALEPQLAKGAHSRFILTPKNQIILTSPGTLRVDVHRFEQSAHQAMREQDAVAARAALRLYVGALLVDDIFEEWTFTRRESLRQLFRTTALSAAERFARDGDPASGIELARRLVHDDAADEPVHLLLMRLHAEAGHKDQALLQFEHCRKAVLAAGLELGSEIVQLQQAIRDGQVPPLRAADRPAHPTALPVMGPWSPHIVPITFQNGVIRSARSSPDGRSVVLTANWDGGVFGLYRLVPDSGDVERLPLEDVELFAVSPRGDLVVGLNPKVWNFFNSVSTLAIQPASGGAPVELLEGVQCADLQPGPGADATASLARRLAIVREIGGRNRLEFPMGHVLFETGGWISHPRFSANGRQIAFLEHPIPMDDEGHVIVLDIGGPQARRERTLSKDLLTVHGLAWLHEKVWFTASRKGASRSLHCVDLDGVERVMNQGLGSLTVHDGAPSLRLLISAERASFGIFARHASDAVERDLTWHEWTAPRDISPDGEMLLVEEAATAGRHHFSAYLRRIDGSSTRLIADGAPLALSPDQRRVILRVPAQPSRLAVLDIESGGVTRLENDDAHPLVHTEYVSFFPDGGRIAFSATDRKGGSRIYIQDLAGGKPVCFTPDVVGVKMLSNRSVAPDGKRIIFKDPDGRLCLYQLADGCGAPLDHLHGEFNLVAWGQDGTDIFVRQWGEMPSRIYRYGLAHGTLREWLALSPRHVGGVRHILCVRLTADGRSYAYGFKKEASDLYAFEAE